MALYLFHLLESQRPHPATGRNKISNKNPKKPAGFSSTVSSFDLSLIINPPKTIKAINIRLMIIEVAGNLTS